MNFPFPPALFHAGAPRQPDKEAGVGVSQRLDLAVPGGIGIALRASIVDAWAVIVRFLAIVLNVLVLSPLAALSVRPVSAAPLFIVTSLIRYIWRRLFPNSPKNKK